jgi:antitoxin PrlF
MGRRDGALAASAAFSCRPSAEATCKVMDLHYPVLMTPITEAEATLTTQNQITIPVSIRKVLQLRGGESRVKFQVTKEGKVLVVRVDPSTPEDEDPALKPFLDLLTKDLREHPERISPFSPKLLKRARALVRDVKVDLDGPLTGDD